MRPVAIDIPLYDPVYLYVGVAPIGLAFPQRANLLTACPALSRSIAPPRGLQRVGPGPGSGGRRICQRPDARTVHADRHREYRWRSALRLWRLGVRERVARQDIGVARDVEVVTAAVLLQQPEGAGEELGREATCLCTTRYRKSADPNRCV